MKLTRERKVLLGLVGAGVLALGVDRAFFKPAGASAEAIVPQSSPQAEQSTQPESNPAQAAAPASAKDDTSSPDERVPLAQRLREIAASQGTKSQPVPDAFAEPKAASIEIAPQQRAADEFLKTHRLTTVMSSAEGGVALVNGKAIRVGQVLDGFTLVRVERMAAVFERDGVEVRLVVAESPARGSGPRTLVEPRP